MSVRVRLTRVGSKKNPIWRVVVADQRSPRDGRVIESIGRYNPQTDPSTIAIDEERYQHWLARGAQPTGTVKQLIKAQAKSGGPAATDQALAQDAIEPETIDAEAPEDVAGPEEAPGSVDAPGAEDASGAEGAPGSEDALGAEGAASPENAGEGAPESAPEGVPAPGAEGLEADPEAAAAERDA